MITNFKDFILIKESPDELYPIDPLTGIYKGRYHWSDKDAIPFFFEVNKKHTEVEKLWLGPKGKTHASMNVPNGLNGKGKYVERAYAGRLWLNHKIISFWVYPNEKLFKSMIEAFEIKLGIKMFNNGWEIEILKTEDNKIKRAEYKKFGKKKDFYFGSRSDYMEGKIYQIISIEDYMGSDDVPEELQIQHLMSCKEKELAKELGQIHFSGFGSDKTAWDQPHNIKYRQAIYQENKKP